MYIYICMYVREYKFKLFYFEGYTFSTKLTNFFCVLFFLIIFVYKICFFLSCNTRIYVFSMYIYNTMTNNLSIFLSLILVFNE